METIGNKRLYEILQKDKFDYVAYVMTQWHVHSLEAALKMLEQKEHRELSGIIVIKPHPVNGYLLNQTSFSNKTAKYYYSVDDEKMLDILSSEVSGILYYILLKKSSRESFYFLRPTGFRYPILGKINKSLQNKKKITVVKLDEGVGTYVNNSATWLKNTLLENTSLKSKIISYVKYYEEKLLNEEKMKNIGQCIDACLFQIRDGVCITNMNFKNYYKESICQFALNTGKLLFNENKNYIIINTQIPDDIFKSGKAISGQILKQCIDIFSKNGYKVFVKTHPRDNDFCYYEKLGAEVIHENLSQEAMLALLVTKPTYIIGFFSTTLVTSSVLFGVKTISLDDIVVDAGEFQNRLLDTVSRFKKSFNNYVFFCKNFEDLEKIAQANPIEVVNEK